jgi:GT2 family glycosyltransferase
MPPQVTIGIPTCGRPAAIEACLASIREHVTVEHRVIVVDSLLTDEATAEYARHPNVRCIGFADPIGPSAARKLISDAADTPYVLFLDDDNLMTPGSTEALLAHLESHPEVEIAAGGWNQDGSLGKRALGQYFHFGRMGERQVIYKSFVTIDAAERLELSSVRVDAVLATMMVRRRLFKDVGFDPQYDFFFELWDFFMQCLERGVHIDALPGVIFEHHPIPYTQTTRRQNSDTADDKRRFAEKWGLDPIGPSGPGAGAHQETSEKRPALGRLGSWRRPAAPSGR